MAAARTPRVSTRIRRTSSRQGPRPPMALVERMQVATIGMVNAFIDRLMREIEPGLRERFDRVDPLPLGDVTGQVSLSEGFLKTVFHSVDRQAAEDLARVVAVPSTRVLKNSTKLELDWIKGNTELIRLEERARAEVRGVIEGRLREGISVVEVRKRIQERLGVVRSRAELIARDQTLKLYGQIQQQRQVQAGIKEYTWSTSEDERVRPDHEDLDGSTQIWDEAPIVDQRSGRRAHPGGDFQCRCAAIPILPLEGEEEQESPAEPLSIEPTPPENDVVAPDPEEERQRQREEREAQERAAQAERERLAAEAERKAALAVRRAELERMATEARRQADLVEAERSARAQRIVQSVTVEPGVPSAARETLTRHIGRISTGADVAMSVEIKAGTEAMPNASGYYRLRERTMVVAAEPKVMPQAGKAYSATMWGVSDVALTTAEVYEQLVTHEYGHHIHVGNYKRVDGLIRQAFRVACPERNIVITAANLRGAEVPEASGGDSPEGSVSVYGTTNPLEFFAEAFTAWHHQHGWMKANRPIAYNMVKRVLEVLSGG